MARRRGSATSSDEDRRGEFAAVAVLCAISAALGLFFVFVRAPHPWGWAGFDHYSDLGLALARGERYPTLDRMWGYPIVLALFYRAFNSRVWPVLVFQVAVNALLPAIVYAGVRERLGRRVAILTALFTATLSLNTVYASTQASDALCTVATAAGVVALARAERRRTTIAWAAAGVLLGLAAQLRPNMLLLPVAFASVLLWRRRVRPTAAALFLVAAVLVDGPWIVRNYRVSRQFIPATTHGGLQLWYGAMQVPPYYSEWTRNPDAVFEATFFDYSPDTRGDLTIAVHSSGCAQASLARMAFQYRVGSSGSFTRVEPDSSDGQGATFRVPRPRVGSAVYYYFDATWENRSGQRISQPTPLAGAEGPFVHFVAIDDLHDLDAAADLLDPFDIVNMMRYLAWRDALPHPDRLDLDGDGAVTLPDLDAAIGTLSQPASLLQRPSRPGRIVRSLDADTGSVTAILRDASSILVPKQWSGSITDVRITGPMAGDVMRSRRSLAGLRLAGALARRYPSASPCLALTPIVDGDFSRREPREDARYRRLALAEIARAPGAFAAASLRRVLDLFVVSGPDYAADIASNGSAGRRLYQAARAVTGVSCALLVAGLWIAWRRGLDLAAFWIPIAYVPITICYMLANMRYTVSVQPFEFVFVAIALDAAWSARSTAAPRRPQTRPDVVPR